MDLDYGFFAETQELINSLVKYGCTMFYKGNIANNRLTTPEGANLEYRVGHEGHLHCGPIKQVNNLEIEYE